MQAIDDAPAERGRRGVGTLLAKGALIAAICTAATLAIALSPNQNDYDQATLLKHDRLAALDGSRKIVLIGGSNLAFGVDSTLIEKATGCPVVNMGMNGYFGIRYMLSEVEPHVGPGDVLVLAFEYDNFYKPVEGTALSLFPVVAANPEAWSYLTWEQRADLVAVVPEVAHLKVMRYLREAVGSVRDAIDGPQAEPESRPQDLDDIETLEGFTPEGDLVSHLGIDWPYDLEDGLDISNLPLEMQAVDLMGDFTGRLRDRGASVLTSFTSVGRDFYTRHQGALERLHRTLDDTEPLVVPSPPAAYVFDDSEMFDTVYHLEAAGRQARTERLVADILESLGDSALCR